ncbi:uncharacterized protein AMSG_08608 [Thecamonas trahens ATCC 50062]|uniref:WD40 repeat domain-containing protein n=1 Tax=Thecamonas trahens ATCC 50062 TaxID=461836 RepID=A0A0L0DMT6_THETB|nr:hypothetical protein AMSG_08608 [Thecamonas trahens ATCC 50062]KNC52728.1 hypothetical protein AMSG_08608 [Thecamonas trahens ATCC 50062]|eukprot:XP_013755042.1 hypothetical protein AMSG_08608 [Thecamonas trahens ATCC 50062]
MAAYTAQTPRHTHSYGIPAARHNAVVFESIAGGKSLRMVAPAGGRVRDTVIATHVGAELSFRASFAAHNALIVALVRDPTHDHRFITVSDDGELALWDDTGGWSALGEPLVLDPLGRTLEAAWSPDGALLAVVAESHGLHIIAVGEETLHQTRFIPMVAADGCTWLNSAGLVVFGRNALSDAPEVAVVDTDAGSLAVMNLLPLTPDGASNARFTASCRIPGSSAVAAVTGARVVFVLTDAGSATGWRAAGSGAPRSMALGPRDEVVYIPCDDARVAGHRHDGQLVRMVALDMRPSVVFALSALPEDRKPRVVAKAAGGVTCFGWLAPSLLAAGTTSGELAILDMESELVISQTIAHPTGKATPLFGSIELFCEVWTVAIGPATGEIRWLATGSEDQTIRIHSVARDGKGITCDHAIVRAHTRAVTAIDWRGSPQASTLISVSDDCVINAFSIALSETSEQVSVVNTARITSSIAIPQWHTLTYAALVGDRTVVAVSQNGYVLTADIGCFSTPWDGDIGNPSWTARIHAGSVEGLAIYRSDNLDEDHCVIATISADCSIHLLELSKLASRSV